MSERGLGQSCGSPHCWLQLKEKSLGLALLSSPPGSPLCQRPKRTQCGEKCLDEMQSFLPPHPAPLLPLLDTKAPLCLVPIAGSLGDKFHTEGQGEAGLCSIMSHLSLLVWTSPTGETSLFSGSWALNPSSI